MQIVSNDHSKPTQPVQHTLAAGSFRKQAKRLTAEIYKEHHKFFVHTFRPLSDANLECASLFVSVFSGMIRPVLIKDTTIG